MITITTTEDGGAGHRYGSKSDSRPVSPGLKTNIGEYSFLARHAQRVRERERGRHVRYYFVDRVPACPRSPRRPLPVPACLSSSL
eukprot:scaffold10880_cov21-Cyclotella_meneghiniana.AAC.1